MSENDDIARRLARILAGLTALVAATGLAARLAGPFLVGIARRLSRLGARFAAAARAPARPSRPAAPAANRSPAAYAASAAYAQPAASAAYAATTSPGADALPRRFAWLILALPATAAIRAQLCHLLDDPAMVALVAARPATGRALRPLCHLLGIRPPAMLRRPARPRPAGPRPARKRQARPRPPRHRPRVLAPPLPESPFILPPGNRACPISPDLRLDTG